MIHWQRARRELVGIPILIRMDSTQEAVNSRRLEAFLHPVFVFILLEFRENSLVEGSFHLLFVAKRKFSRGSVAIRLNGILMSLGVDRLSLTTNGILGHDENNRSVVNRVGNAGTLAISEPVESLFSNSSDINTCSEIFFENTYAVASEPTIIKNITNSMHMGRCKKATLELVPSLAITEDFVVADRATGPLFKVGASRAGTIARRRCFSFVPKVKDIAFPRTSY
jgi:hypothetical protein